MSPESGCADFEAPRGCDRCYCDFANITIFDCCSRAWLDVRRFDAGPDCVALCRFCRRAGCQFRRACSRHYWTRAAKATRADQGISAFAVAGIFALIASQAQEADQRETRWAELRQADPEAYLAELAPIDQERWLEELSELRPERYAQEIARRETELQAQREAEAAEAARRAEAEAAERREADTRAAAAAQRLIAGSDDLDEHRAVFGRFAVELVENGTGVNALMKLAATK